jgi:hypothetical protein
VSAYNSTQPSPCDFFKIAKIVHTHTLAYTISHSFSDSPAAEKTKTSAAAAAAATATAIAPVRPTKDRLSRILNLRIKSHQNFYDKRPIWRKEGIE